MSETIGCPEVHVTTPIADRVAAAMAADAGEETWEWAWPIETGIPKDL